MNTLNFMIHSSYHRKTLHKCCMFVRLQREQRGDIWIQICVCGWRGEENILRAQHRLCPIRARQKDDAWFAHSKKKSSGSQHSCTGKTLERKSYGCWSKFLGKLFPPPHQYASCHDTSKEWAAPAFHSCCEQRRDNLLVLHKKKCLKLFHFYTQPPTPHEHRAKTCRKRCWNGEMEKL